MTMMESFKTMRHVLPAPADVDAVDEEEIVGSANTPRPWTLRKRTASIISRCEDDDSDDDNVSPKKRMQVSPKNKKRRTAALTAAKTERFEPPTRTVTSGTSVIDNSRTMVAHDQTDGRNEKQQQLSGSATVTSGSSSCNPPSYPKHAQPRLVVNHTYHDHLNDPIIFPIHHVDFGPKSSGMDSIPEDYRMSDEWDDDLEIADDDDHHVEVRGWSTTASSSRSRSRRYSTSVLPEKPYSSERSASLRSRQPRCASRRESAPPGGTCVRKQNTNHHQHQQLQFPEHLHAMLTTVEEENLTHIISWQPHGRCFVIHQKQDFVNLLVNRFFHQTKLTSFQRQLNLYGFSRITAGRDRGAYYHELFLRGRVDLCRRMVRTRIKGNGMKAAASPSTEPNFYEMTWCFGLGENGATTSVAAVAQPATFSETKVCQREKKSSKKRKEKLAIAGRAEERISNESPVTWPEGTVEDGTSDTIPRQPALVRSNWDADGFDDGTDAESAVASLAAIRSGNNELCDSATVPASFDERTASWTVNEVGGRHNCSQSHHLVSPVTTSPIAMTTVISDPWLASRDGFTGNPYIPFLPSNNRQDGDDESNDGTDLSPFLLAPLTHAEQSIYDSLKECVDNEDEVMAFFVPMPSSSGTNRDHQNALADAAEESANGSSMKCDGPASPCNNGTVGSSTRSPKTGDAVSFEGHKFCYLEHSAIEELLGHPTLLEDLSELEAAIE